VGTAHPRTTGALEGPLGPEEGGRCPPDEDWDKYPGNPIIQNNDSSAILVRTPRGDRLYTMHSDVKVFEPAANSAPAP
jgi:hypothetical protein